MKRGIADSEHCACGLKKRGGGTTAKPRRCPDSERAEETGIISLHEQIAAIIVG